MYVRTCAYIYIHTTAIANKTYLRVRTYLPSGGKTSRRRHERATATGNRRPTSKCQCPFSAYTVPVFQPAAAIRRFARGYITRAIVLFRYRVEIDHRAIENGVAIVASFISNAFPRSTIHLLLACIFSVILRVKFRRELETSRYGTSFSRLPITDLSLSLFLFRTAIVARTLDGIVEKN